MKQTPTLLIMTIIGLSMVFSCNSDPGKKMSNDEDKSLVKAQPGARSLKSFLSEEDCSSQICKVDCNSSECILKATRCHLIAVTKFREHVDSFNLVYGNVPVKETPYLVDDVKTLIEKLDCQKGQFIMFNKFQEDDHIILGALTPITSSAHPITDTTTEPQYNGRYSTSLFKGLIDSFGLRLTDTFHFCKIYKDGKPSVAVRFTSFKNPASTMQYADLSQYYP